MHRHALLARLVSLSALALAAVACSGDDAAPTEVAETLTVDCGGKCDGWGSVKSLYRDATRLDLGDLLSVGAGYATDGLNDALSFTDYAQLKLAEPKLYALSDKAEDDLTLGNVDKLVSGLTERFGHRELTTEVNAVRQRHLQISGDEVYVEAAFSISSGLNHSWNIPSGGFDVSTVLGFDSNGTLKARVISAFDSELKATAGGPLRAVKETRGFVMPRSLADVRAMKPGELLALQGQGGLGLNLGVGVPILIAQPLSSVSYSLVLSAGLRTHLQGTMDVQLVRLDGDEVVIDVGVDSAAVRSARVAVTDGWGVQGLLELSANVGGYSLDLGSLVEKALQKQLNQRLDFIHARYEATKKRSRLTVARLRFALDAGDPVVLEQAIAQALRGDVRLAQALAARGEPGVTAAFDLTRSGVSAASYAGLDLFGMSFFREVEEASGTAVVQTPGGARTLMFDSLHKEAGWFFSSHGFTRVSLSGLIYDPQDPRLPTGEANLFIQVEEGDDYMERDKMLDHLDGILVALGGRAALTAIEGPGNQLERYVVGACPNSQAFDPCRSQVLTHPTVVQLRADGMAALEQAMSGLAPEQKELLRKCGALRLTAQATYEPQASLVGPQSSVVLDYRLDNAALASLMQGDNEFKLRAALVEYLRAVEIDRGDRPEDIAGDRADIEGDAKGELDDMRDAFATHARKYRHLAEAESAVIDRLGPVGPRAIEIRFPVSAEQRPMYEDATAAALSQVRARVVRDLFDELYAIAGELDPHPEQTVAYGLLSLTPAPLVDLRVNLDMDLDDTWAQSYDHYREAGYAPFDAYARGASVSPIDGGLFDVNALLNVK